MTCEAKSLFETARHDKTCLPAFNVYNLETVQAAFEASEKAERPGMIAFGAAYEKHMPVEAAAALVRTLRPFHPGARMLLHLDHCSDMEVLRRAVNAGFDSVMFDGSTRPLKENITLTTEAAAYAHSRGIAIEGELGGLNPEDGGPEDPPSPLTDPEQACRFVRETEVDLLAVSAGNAHGFYHDTPNLHMDLLRRIYKVTGIPLVLHGCSGIPHEQLREAVQLAVVKINVNTEVAAAGIESLHKQLQSIPAPRKLNQILPELQSALRDAMLPFFNI